MIRSTNVSVVVPAYNRAFCVCDAVGSVLDQSRTDVECIVVDDGSSDDTAHVVTSAFGNEARVRVLAQEHAGVSAARNRGLADASGRYVTFLDSDDLMVPRRVEHQLDRLAQGDADAVIGRQELQLAGAASFPDWLQRRPDWWNEYYHLSILLEARHVREVGGFDEMLETGEDVDLVVRLVAGGLRVAVLDETVVTRRYFGDNLTYRVEPGDRALLRAARRNVARRRSRVEP